MHTSSRRGKMHTSNPISFKAMMTVLAALALGAAAAEARRLHQVSPGWSQAPRAMTQREMDARAALVQAAAQIDVAGDWSLVVPWVPGNANRAWRTFPQLWPGRTNAVAEAGVSKTEASPSPVPTVTGVTLAPVRESEDSTYDAAGSTLRGLP